MKKIFTLLFATASALGASAQCPGGQAMVTVDVATDAWGYECFWDITATGAGCGNGALMTFGNTAEVGCAGGGAQVATAGGYANSTTTTETIGCVPLGTCYDINYVDDWGDGGATFTVYVNGIGQAPLVGAGTGNVWNVCITAPAVNDVDMVVTAMGEYTKIPLSQLSASLMIGTGGTISSLGSGNVTGATMSVVVLQGAASVYTATSAAQNIATGASANFTVAGYNPTAIGVYTITYTSDITETDEDLTNNVFSYTFEVTDSTYARDNGSHDGTLGIGAGEVGYMGNIFVITDGAMVSTVEAFISNAAADITGNAFSVEIFATDAMGTPTTSLATATSNVDATADHWYTLDVVPNLYLAPGTYLVAAREEVAYQQQLGTSNAIFTAGKTWVSWTSQPWALTETFAFNIAFMVRANVNQYASVSELDATELTVYPNPAQNQLNVSGVSVGATINVYNNVGQVVLTTVASNNLMTLDVANFVSGIYTVKTVSGSNVGVAKFVKN